MSKNKTVIVEGTMFWPSLTTINKLAGKYTFDLGQLSDEAVAAIESLGSNSNIRTKALRSEDDFDRGQFITIKSKFPIKFKDTGKNDMSEDDLSRLGNGTKVRVKLGTYEAGSFGTFVKMVAGAVIEPVFYTAKDDLFTEEDSLDDAASDLFG